MLFAVQCFKHLRFSSFINTKSSHCWRALRTASNTRVVKHVLSGGNHLECRRQSCIFEAPLLERQVSLVRLQQTMGMQTQRDKKTQLVESTRGADTQLTFAEKVKEGGKDATYTGVIIAGVVVTGLMFYAIGKELFSGQSPSGVYSSAFKMCQKNDEVIAMFGEPLKARGEMTSRGRSRHVKHMEFEQNGVKAMRLMFHLQGPQNKGTVHVEAKQDERGKYQFVYIYVEPERYPRFAVVDNR